jgi:hypothetical protein
LVEEMKNAQISSNDLAFFRTSEVGPSVCAARLSLPAIYS